MRRLLVAILSVLLLVGNAAAWKSSNEIADITYLLRCWPTGLSIADQSYTNGQVIDTPAEGCLDGSLTAYDASGELSALSSNLKLLGDGSWWNNWVYSGAVTRNIGKGILSSLLSYNVSLASVGLFITDEQTASGAAITGNRCYSMNIGSGLITGAAYDCANTNKGVISIYPASVDTRYPVAIVLGGYDSGGVPYKVGDVKTSYLYGASFYYKTEAGAWTLYYRSDYGNTSTLYALVGVQSATGGNVNNFDIPNYDFSSVLQPTFLDTFTGVDGTSLADHTPDVGGAWTAQAGSPSITSNRFQFVTGENKATVDTLVSNVYLSVSGMHQYTDDSNRSGIGLLFRYTDNDNHFYAYANRTSTASYFRLYSIESSTQTERGSGSSPVSSNTSLTITVIANGNAISCYENGASSISYSSSFNNTATSHGVRIYGTGTPPNSTYLDNFAVWPLTSATYTSEFAKVGY